MSIKCVICDDDASIAAQLAAWVDAYALTRGLQIEVRSYRSGEEILKSSLPFDILFIDIFMPGMSGIDVVRSAEISKTHPVVFITTSMDHAIEAFGLNAVHYLLKPLTAPAVSEALDRCIAHLDTDTGNVLRVKTGHDTIPVDIAGIKYIEVNNKVSVLHLPTGDLETYTPLDELYSQLPPELFMKAQRSFVVNMRYIESFFYDHICLKNGEDITLSRPARGELKNQYQQFLFRLARRHDE